MPIAIRDVPVTTFFKVSFPKRKRRGRGAWEDIASFFVPHLQLWIPTYRLAYHIGKHVH